MATKTAPQVLKGTRDILPAQMIVRQHAIDTLRKVFERFGFEPLETPALEYAETLTGKYGEEADKLIYQFEDRGGRKVGLRYDLTVPLARVVALYPELVKPFKRYHIAPVWRAEKPQKGRYREFTQCDIDIAGSTSLLCDAEVVAVAEAGLVALGLDEFTVKINDRKLLAAISAYAGAPSDRFVALCRGIDKLDKIGEGAVREELGRAGIEPVATDRVFDLINLGQGRGGDDPLGLLEELRPRLAATERGTEGIDELVEVVTYLRELGVSPRHWRVDLSMVRGLDYYTGPIFEATLDNLKIGSISGGGRYDGLVGMFGSQPVPAVGLAFGLDRLIVALEELGLGPGADRKTKTEVLVTIFSPETRAESLRLASELRNAGLNVEVALNMDKLQNQLRYASRKSIPYAIILGSDEIAKGEVVVKDLVRSEQKSLPREAVASEIRKSYG